MTDRFDTLMTNSMEVWRRSATPDSHGQPGALAKVSTADVACRLSPLSWSQRQALAQMAVGSSMVFCRPQSGAATFSPAREVNETDYVRVGGVTYDVLMVRPVTGKDQSLGTHHLEIVVRVSKGQSGGSL